MAWERMLPSVNPLNRLYASPVWFEHLHAVGLGDDLRLSVLRDDEGRIAGVSPLLFQRRALTFDIAGRVLTRSSMRTATMLGSEPVVSECPDVHRRIVEGIFRAVPSLQCVYLDAQPIDSPMGESTRSGGRGPRSYFAYQSPRNRPWHWTELGESFDTYLNAMKGKTRYTIRKKIRELRQHGGGSLELQLIDSEDQVGDFLVAAQEVAQKSWQYRVLGQRIGATEVFRRELGDLAARGLLRAYLLKCGGKPCAFLAGYQYDGVYQYGETAFDESLGELSPGSALHYLVFEDLFRHDKPWAFNFGVGDAAHKRRFSNRESVDTSVYLLRRTPGNHVRSASHALFASGKHLTRWVLRRKVTK